MRRARGALWAVLGIVVVLALVGGGIALWANYNKSPLPIEDRCTATAGGRTTDPQRARVDALEAERAAQQRGLAAPRRTDHTLDARRWRRDGDVVEEGLAAAHHPHLLGFDHASCPDSLRSNRFAKSASGTLINKYSVAVTAISSRVACVDSANTL